MIDTRFYDLIAHLWRGGQYAYWWTPDDGTGQKLTWWTGAGSMSTVPNLFLDKDAYFSVHPSNIRRSEHERARIDDIMAINCLYCEFDCPTEADKSTVLAKIETWSIQPACVVDSGGGYHVYVWLRDVLPLVDATRQRAIDLQWAFAQWAGGDTSVNDLARVLRIPGTINHKAKYAPNFPPVVIVQWDTTQQHDLSNLEAILQPIIDQRNAAKAHTSHGAPQAVSLSDTQLLDVLFRSKNGSQYQALWSGDLSSVGGDHSKGDQVLCNGLAWVTGRDTHAMDSLFRQSGLYREKWAKRDDYREKTLENAANSAQTVYTPNYVDPVAVGVAQAAVNGNGSHAGVNGSHSPSNGASAPQATTAKQTKHSSYKIPKDPTTADYIDALQYAGYYFRLNDLDDHIEVNGQRLDDVTIKTIRNKMRDLGFRQNQLTAIEDAYWQEAGDKRYHPIREYLQNLQWDGDDHIRLLARHFEDKHAPIVYADGSSETVFYVWLKRWLIAAVAKVYQSSQVAAQNAVLVLEGGQNLGKSTFARWLCSGMPRYFIEKSIEPDSKEDERRLASNWIWEVGELGATTRKADREALKSFLTKIECKFRNAYAKEDSEKKALASFIGTVNNEGGFLQDSTGTRRFMTIGLLKIHHSYIQDVDVNQVWAQAHQLYATGEIWRLTADEDEKRAEINSDYKIEDAYEGWVLRYFDIDPARRDAKTVGWFITTQELVSELKKQGVTDNTTALTMRLAATMKELGLEKSRQFGRTGPRGYWGVKLKP